MLHADITMALPDSIMLHAEITMACSPPFFPLATNPPQPVLRPPPVAAPALTVGWAGAGGGSSGEVGPLQGAAGAAWGVAGAEGGTGRPAGAAAGWGPQHSAQLRGRPLHRGLGQA